MDIDFSKIDREEPSSHRSNGLLSRYIKSPSVQLEELTQSSFGVKELIEFYDEKEGETTLPGQPDTAKDVSEIFEEVESSWSEGSVVWYGIIDHSKGEGYIGDLMLGPIDWDKGQVSVKFYIPDEKQYISDIIGSLVFVMTKDLGLDLIRVHASGESSEQTNSIIKDLNGEYEGEKRVYNRRGVPSLVHSWSVTAPEILNDEKSIQTGFSYNGKGDSSEE